jgi:hypothetical protein
MKTLKMIDSKFRIATTLVVCLFFFTMVSCSKDDPETRQETSIIPDTYRDRPVEAQGVIETGSKNVTFNVWDSGVVDGDIVTLVVNGVVVLDTFTLLGTEHSIPVTLPNLGYNYVLLFAHNEGSLTPNTAALSITDSDGNVENLTLSADLETNGAYDVIVN